MKYLIFYKECKISFYDIYLKNVTGVSKIDEKSITMLQVVCSRQIFDHLVYTQTGQNKGPPVAIKN
jgi:hypothetical protein